MRSFLLLKPGPRCDNCVRRELIVASVTAVSISSCLIKSKSQDDGLTKMLPKGRSRSQPGGFKLWRAESQGSKAAFFIGLPFWGVIAGHAYCWHRLGKPWLMDAYLELHDLGQLRHLM